MINFNFKYLIILLILFFNFSVNASNKYNIQIIGNEFLDSDNILSSIIQLEEDNIDIYINKIFNKLNSSGNFKNINITKNQDKIIINLEENLKIINVLFNGNKRFKDEDLQKIFQEIFLYNYYTKTNEINFIKELENIYYSFGYNNFNLKINKTLITNNLDLKIDIVEGEISKINKIFFTGNISFDSNKLKDFIKSKPKRDLLFFLNRNFKLYELKNDIVRLQKFYSENGYKDIVINYKTEFMPKKNKFNIYLYINEGKKYYIKEFNLTNNLININKKLSDELQSKFDKQILKIFNKEDNIFNSKIITKNQNMINDYLFENGIIFFETNILQKINKNNVIITYQIAPIDPKYVNEINILGNTRTKDEVIRRELAFNEGDSVNDFLISQSNRNIQYLNIFKKVEFKERKIDDDLVDLDIVIEEKPTGDFKVGVGVNSLDGVTFISGLKENNIGGSGRNLELSVNTAANNTEYIFDVTEPHIFNKKINLIYGFNYKENDYTTSSSYTTSTFGSKLGFSYFLSDDLRQSIFFKYNLKDYTISDASKVSNDILSAAGKNAELLLINNLSYNKLNSFVRPTDGYNVFFETQLSPVTNSDDGYLKNFITYKNYLEYKTFIFSARSRIGNIYSLQDKSIVGDNKFSLGGNSLRGFDSNGVGPRKSKTSYVGGNNLISFNFDLSKPLNRNSDNPIDFKLFSDIGKIYGNKTNPTYSTESIRASYGFGINFYSPVGPVGLSWAFPACDESYDIKRMFLFSIGNLN